jgi:arsenite methyltransferase
MKEEIKNYYGNELKKSEDLKTNACCTLSPPPAHIKEALSRIHDEVLSKYYGCGLTIPSALNGLTVLDLGSGSGRDCYLLSQLVGESGRVVGVDMTDEQLDVAKKHLSYHQQKFGYKKSNVEFIKGDIEKLDECLPQGLEFDLVVSNCVLNLASDKKKVLRDVHSLLKEGGEFYFSDVYADRRVPDTLRRDPVLWSECLSGALYWNDFLTIAKASGFIDPRCVENKEITVNNDELKNKLGKIRFFSVTYRLFKNSKLESDCEEYGQAIRYRGGIKEMPDTFTLDGHHAFEKGRIYSVCGNSYLMLAESRLREYFDFYGSFETHYGIFEGCGTNMPFTVTKNDAANMNCC